jgi:protein TonB
MNYMPGQNYQIRYTLAIALVLHGLVMLATTLAIISGAVQLNQSEVTLAVSSSEEIPLDAELLAQNNQLGSGQGDKHQELTVTQEALFADTKINQIDPIFLPKEDRGANEPIELRIITTTSESALFAPSRDISIEESDNNGAINNERKTLADLSLEIASLEARLAEKQQPDGKKSRVLILTSASTLAADNAEYVHQCRNRVETVGNIHYPREARANQLYGDVRLLVKLQASGIVEEIIIMSSSGSTVLDSAAIESIRLASPFEPFPKSLANKYDRIDVIRTWQFRENRLSAKPT